MILGQAPSRRELNILPHPDQAVVTGAFSFTGRYVARPLLDEGVNVRTLTRNPGRDDPLGVQVEEILKGMGSPTPSSARRWSSARGTSC